MFEDWFRYNEPVHQRRAWRPRLTIRQTEVRLMVEQNLSYQEMCAKTGAVESAISQTIGQLRKKYGVEMREELAALMRYQNELSSAQEADEPAGAAAAGAP